MRSRQALILSIILFPVILLIYCNNRNSSAESAFLNLNDSVKYVGMQTCLKCHSDKHETFIHTGMGKSFDHASLSKTSSKDTKHAFVFDKRKNFWYHPYWQNDSMFIEQFRLNGDDTVFKRIEKISYIIGSGQHTNSHIWNENGFLFQAPITYYTQEKLWDLAPGASDFNGVGFERIISSECMNCHNMYSQFDFTSVNKFVSVKTGIECERCHGPGALHVQEKFAGHLVDTKNETDFTIVNPKRLSRDLQTELCQRCHMQGITVLNENKTVFDFKPGMKLNEVMNVFMPRYTNDNLFIMASHADRMKQSKCYSGTSTFTCITCHDPHISVEETPLDKFNETCKSCHHESCTNSPELNKMANDNCVQCHMPLSPTLDIPNVQIHDHKIRIVTNPDSGLQKFTHLECMTTPNPSALLMAQGYLATFESYSSQPFLLDSCKKYLDLTTEKTELNFQTLIHYYFLENDFNSIVHLTISKSVKLENDAWTCYRIGESFQQIQEFNTALPWFLRAIELMPNVTEFLNKTATCYLSLNLNADAEKIIDKIIDLNPKDEEANCNKGFCLLMKGDMIGSKTYYEKSLALNPDYVTVLLNLGGWYYLNKSKQQSIFYFNRVLSIDPNNVQAVQSLNMIKNLNW